MTSETTSRLTKSIFTATSIISDGAELNIKFTIAIVLVMAVSQFVSLEGCTNNPNSLTGTWNLEAATGVDSGQVVVADSGSATGSLTLNANFSFMAKGTISSQSLAQSLNLPVGYSGNATGGYSYSGSDNIIVFNLTGWSGGGNQSGSASGTYIISGNSLSIKLNIGTAIVSLNFVRGQ